MKTTRTVVIETTICDRCKKDLPDGDVSVSAAVQVGEFKTSAQDLCGKCATAVLNGLRRLRIDGREDAEAPAVAGQQQTEMVAANPEVEPRQDQAERFQVIEGGQSQESAPVAQDGPGASFSEAPNNKNETPPVALAGNGAANVSVSLLIKQNEERQAKLREIIARFKEKGQNPSSYSIELAALENARCALLSAPSRPQPKGSLNFQAADKRPVFHDPSLDDSIPF